MIDFFMIGLTPKVLEAIFQAFLKFGQAIVDAMFVQKISNFGEHVVLFFIFIILSTTSTFQSNCYSYIFIFSHNIVCFEY
jgi:hypothetical protein